MEGKLRQRLIGAAVLAALAVIFMPMLFKHQTIQTQSGQITISADLPSPAQANSSTAQPATSPDKIQNQQIVTSAPANNPVAAPIANPNQIAFGEQAELGSPVSKQLAANANADADANKIIHEATTQPAASKTDDEDIIQQTAKQTVSAPTKPTKHVAAVQKIVDKSNKHIVAQKDPAKFVADTVSQSLEQSISQAGAVTSKKIAKTDKVVALEKPAIASTPAATTDLANASAEKWIIQLGSFSNIDNAKKLELKLRARGFAANTEEISSSHGSLTRVFIGPENKQEQAQNILTKLTSELRVNGVVVPVDGNS